MSLDKRAAEILEGYARANEFLETERIERLARLTLEQGRAEYDDLIESWDNRSDKAEGLERLELWRAETMIAVRHAFEKLARAKGPTVRQE